MACFENGLDTNLNGLRSAIIEARSRAWKNNLFGHLLTLLQALATIGVALLALASGNDAPLLDWRAWFIGIAAVPSAVSILDKALRPSQWEAWYARKALALEAVWRHVQSSDNPDLAGNLQAPNIDWWNLVDEEFEKTRPTWGPRDTNELGAVRKNQT